MCDGNLELSDLNLYSATVYKGLTTPIVAKRFPPYKKESGSGLNLAETSTDRSCKISATLNSVTVSPWHVFSS